MQDVLKEKATSKLEIWGKIFHTNKKVFVLLISNKTEFKAKCIEQIKEGYFILITNIFPRRCNCPEHSMFSNNIASKIMCCIKNF